MCLKRFSKVTTYSILMAALLSSSAFAQSRINPFTRTGVSIFGGYEAGVMVGAQDGNGFLAVGVAQVGNVGAQIDFAAGGNADECGGFEVFVGPRFATSFMMLDSAGLFVVIPVTVHQDLVVFQELDLAIKPVWSFQAGSGYVAPYVNILLGINGGVGGQQFMMGGNVAVYGGFHHYFSRHVGWFAELGLKYLLFANTTKNGPIINTLTTSINAGLSFAF